MVAHGQLKAINAWSFRGDASICQDKRHHWGVEGEWGHAECSSITIHNLSCMYHNHTHKHYNIGTNLIFKLYYILLTSAPNQWMCMASNACWSCELLHVAKNWLLSQFRASTISIPNQIPKPNQMHFSIFPIRKIIWSTITYNPIIIQTLMQIIHIHANYKNTTTEQIYTYILSSINISYIYIYSNIINLANCSLHFFLIFLSPNYTYQCCRHLNRE